MPTEANIFTMTPDGVKVHWRVGEDATTEGTGVVVDLVENLLVNLGNLGYGPDTSWDKGGGNGGGGGPQNRGNQGGGGGGGQRGNGGGGGGGGQRGNQGGGWGPPQQRGNQGGRRPPVQTPPCPDCGGPMYYNPPGQKMSANSPDYKCKDKQNCGTAGWKQPDGTIQWSTDT